MSRTFTFRRSAAVLGVLAIIGGASGITACSEGFGDRFLPHPPEENTATDATDGAGSSDRHGRSDEGERRPPRALRPDRRGGDRSESPRETERTEQPPDDAPHAAGDHAPTAGDSVTLHPDGKALSLTRGGSTLSFGETATVATSADDGRLFVWDITVYDKVVRSPDQVRLSDPSQGQGVDHYVCYAYDVVFMGVDNRSAEDPPYSGERPTPPAPPFLPPGRPRLPLTGQAPHDSGVERMTTAASRCPIVFRSRRRTSSGGTRTPGGRLPPSRNLRSLHPPPRQRVSASTAIP